MKDELTISVNIAERPYRLTIRRDEEEIIRNAATEINSKLKFYSEHFAYNDRQDLLAMVTLEKTADALIAKKSGINNDAELASKLAGIDNLLLENLKKN